MSVICAWHLIIQENLQCIAMHTAGCVSLAVVLRNPGDDPVYGCTPRLQAHRVWHQVQVVQPPLHHLVRCQVSGVRYQVSGVRWQIFIADFWAEYILSDLQCLVLTAGGGM